MKTITTEIYINATREKVWQILTDFKKFPEWNPFVVKISGEPAAGATLDVTLQIEGRKPSTFKPVVINCIENEKFCWKGKLFFKGLFDGTHFFNLEETEEGLTKLVQGENFSGILVNSIMNKIENATLQGFKKMNQALKELAEKGAQSTAG